MFMLVLGGVVVIKCYTLRIQGCPRSGITPTFLFFSDGIDDWTPHSYGFLGTLGDGFFHARHLFFQVCSLHSDEAARFARLSNHAFFCQP